MPFERKYKNPLTERMRLTKNEKDLIEAKRKIDSDLAREIKEAKQKRDKRLCEKKDIEEDLEEKTILGFFSKCYIPIG